MFLNNEYRPYLQDFDKFVAYFDSLARKYFEMGAYKIFFWILKLESLFL